MDHNVALVWLFILLKVTSESQKQNKLGTSQRGSTVSQRNGTNPDIRTYSLINESVLWLDDATRSPTVSIRSGLQVNNVNR